MKVGDLIKWKRNGWIGVVLDVYEGSLNEFALVKVELVTSDGRLFNVKLRVHNLEVICEGR
mgnify:CR=1 FL=1